MTLDGGITSITGTELETGTVYVYYRKNSRFVYTQELTNDYVKHNAGNNFGNLVIADENEIVVNIPSTSNSTIKPGFVVFDKINTAVNSLKKVTSQDVFVNIEPINRIAVIDTNKDEILQYLDIYDPLKGRIPGIAEQELSYKLMND
jgi:hypothetical protein